MAGLGAGALLYLYLDCVIQTYVTLVNLFSSRKRGKSIGGQVMVSGYWSEDVVESDAFGIVTIFTFG